MIFEKIAGWFDFADIYMIAIIEALQSREDKLFIEVGAWLGRSTASLNPKQQKK